MGERDLDRVRTSYDRVAPEYAARFGDELAGNPVDRALLQAFAELVRATGVLAVADVGCGPGHVTAHLAGLGLDARGIDLSPGMVAQARAGHPGLRFDVGSMTALQLPDGALGGIGTVRGGAARLPAGRRARRRLTGPERADRADGADRAGRLAEPARSAVRSPRPGAWRTPAAARPTRRPW
ncbi:methyltransferase domain-containing protein [Nakamurella endophytica]|uniref:methyltransferase domain-containing protein n=1 Tax=Nakamurella endophytica TaxID=1748367 RepID=UPI001663A7EF|nr:class I SAM-dependent methyltransferase [Nakamurella endophytica]